MKKFVLLAFLLAFFGVLALPTAEAQAMIIVKNYTRYSSEYADEYNDTYNRAALSRSRFDSADKRPETGPYKGWKSIFNIFF